MVEAKPTSLVKPSIETPFHVDFSWWQTADRDWKVYLRSLLCSEHSESYVANNEGEMIDWVDPETAEVVRVDGLQHVLLSHCAQQEDFLGEHTAVVEAIFRLFMMNGNTPMTVVEIGEKLDRPAKPLLRTLSGSRVYRGIRPIIN